MQIDAIYFDGETARDRPVRLTRMGGNLQIEEDSLPPTSWSIGGLHAIDTPAPGQPFRLTHVSKPGARLVIRDEAFVKDLLAQNKALHGGYGWRHVGQVLGWTAGGIGALMLAGYIALSVLPQQVANLLPQSWRTKAGEQFVQSLVGDSNRCDTPAGRSAMAAMVGTLAEGRPDMPPISVEVYNLPIVNAFAVPGGRIIMTRELLKTADEPSEIAGVLAHELGHVALKHPEAQMVRVAGLEVLMGALGGGSSTMKNAAGLAALLRYSREAESEADAYARETLVAASVDPIGFKHFFEKIQKLEGGSNANSKDGKQSSLSKIGNLFSTHPGTEERIQKIEPLPAGKTPVPVLDAAEWAALKSICGG